MKVLKYFYKKGFGKRVLSMTMAFLMLFTMFAGQLPAGLLEVKAATIASPEVVGNEVTFRYENSGASSVALAGTMNGWSTTATQMTKGNDGVWTHTATLEDGIYQYKFVVNGNSWKQDPKNPNGLCGDNSVVAVNVPLATSVDGLDVTFRYYNPDASKVCLAGTMNGWSSTATPMTKNEYGVWTITQTLTAGSHEYKFVVGSDWHTDPNNSLKASNGNSLITVVDETAPEIISPEVNGKEVTFRYYSKAASTVQLAGGMTEWGTNPIPMTETDNIFETTVELTPGSYQYKFIVDGSWIIDPENEKVFTEPSGNQNSLAIVAGLLDGTATVVKGEETVLSVSRYNEDETTSVATGVTFALAEDTYASDVAIDGDKITVSKDCEATELVVNATLGEETAKLTLTLGEAEITTFDVTLHIYNADGWSQMALYAWNHASFSGYSSWPGKQILTNETLKAGEWYEYTVKDVEAGAGKLIINNNDNGKQTLDLDFTVSAEQNELWVVAGDKGGLNPGLVVYSEDDVVINEPSAGFDVTLHIYNADGWSQMALYAWNHASFSGYSSWPGKQLFAGQTLATGEWYEYTVEGVEAGVGKLIINNNNNGKQTKDLDFSISANQNELWVVAGDKGGLNPGAVFYSEDDVVINTPESATEYKVTAHFYNEDNWSKVNAYAKEGTSTNWSNIMGFEAYGEWPGKEISENAEHDNWYDLTITKYGDADVLVIYNNGSSQTDDLVLTIDGEENEYWYTKAGLVTTAPDAWTNAGGTGPVVPADDDVTLHIYNADGWNKMALYAWDDAQNKLLGAWPGKQILADQTLADDTWYDYTLEGFEPGKVNLIVNNNGSGKQTNDLVFNITETAKEFWVVAASVGGVYNSKAEAEEALSEKIVSPEVNGFEVTFRYIDPSATKVNLAGTMNGWSQTATPMTKDSKGVWSVTLTLAAGTHQYKFVVNNGAAWVTDPSNSAALVDGNSVVSVENPIEVISPEVDGKNVTFRYYSEVATKVYLAGSMTDWANGKKEMTETDDLFEITVELEKGAHEYKFIYATAESAENWTTDPSNTMSANGNSVVYVPGLLDTTASVVRGEATEISATQKYLNLDGSKSDVAVTYTLADAALADVVTIDGNKITVKADSDLESFKLTATTEADDTAVVVVSVAEPGVKPEEVISPEVNGREVTFRYQSDSALEVYLAGSMNGWSGNTTAMTKGEENIFTYTGTYAPGKYQYKFVIGDSWIVDPLNTDKVDDGYGGFNSQFIVSGLCDVADSATKGEVKELPTELVYYNTKGETSKVPVTYTVTETADLAYVTLDGNKLTVAGNCSKASITLTATATVGGKEVTAKVDVAVYDKQYTYTIYAYSENADRMTVDAAALWIWDKAKETSTPDAEYEFTGTEELSDGKTWLKAEVTVGFSKELGIIFRSKGGWTWQTSDLIFENTEKKDCTLYIVEGKGKIYTSLDDIYNEPEEAYRYLVVEYTRDDNDYSDTNVYTWANGLAENTQGYPFEEVNGKYIAKVPVVYSETEMNVGFIVRKGNDWSYAVKDGGDNFAAFPANQEVVKVKFHDAKVTSQYPYNMGGAINRSANAVSFYYRDDAAFLADTLASLAGKVQVVVKSSTGNADIDGTHTMTYDEANGRFTYNVPLTDDTDYCYYYLVDGAKVLDAYNEKKITIADEEYSIIRNKTYQVNMTASVKNDAMDYNDNNLLYVAWEPKAGASLDGFVVTELYADLSELGLGKVAIDPELKALSIACDDSVPAGTKTITVTLVDDCDSSHQATATVKVTERTKKANTEEKLGDFDWDEAVIYFAVTDRFYDGNTANNTLVDAADTTDGSRYHGGDLAGLTAKIDYLYDLGINTIWLTPIVDNIDQNVRDAEDNTDGQESYGYHGYWASDFEALNPHLGTEAELKALVEAAHAKGMKIMVDVVLNHAGYETEDYFNTILTDGNGGYIDMIRGSEETVSGDDKLSSLSGLPDFLTENEEVRNQLIEWQTDWVEKYDIDYYRVDTVKHVDNTTWAAFKNALTEIDPEFKLIGEYYGASYTSTAGQLDSGKMDSLLDFGFKDYAREFVYGNLSSVEAKLAERNGMLDNTSTLGSFLSSHDEAGFLYNLKNSVGAAKAEGLMKVAATLQITAKGQPVIYYGEEIGISGANNYPAQDNRADFDWTKLASQESDADSLYNHYKTMLNIRRDYSEIFAKGDRGIAAISDSEGYEVISRSYEGENLYVAMNVKDTAKTVSFLVTAVPGSVYTDLYSGTEYTVADNGKVTITIPKATAGGSAVLVLTEGENAVVEDTNRVTVKLHYNRPDGNYTDWNVWFWADGMGGNAYEFVNEGGEMVATVTVSGRSTTKVNYIVRKGDWEAKDVDADQSIDISDIVSGTVHFYVNAGVPGGTRVLGADAIKGSKIVSSMYDRETNTVEVVVSTPASVDKNEAFTITRTDGKVIGIESVSYSDNTYTLVLKDDISALKDVLKSYTLRYEGYDYGLGMPNLYASEEFESQYTYEGNDLGATWSKKSTTFKVWAPTADSVKVALYKSGTEGKNDLIKIYDMKLGEQGVWSVKVSGDLNGKYYTYLVDVNGETEEACDPYARTTGVNGKRAMVINLDSTDPKGWDKDVSPNKGMSYTDAVIYELHVRDASIHESSGVSAANKGKFLGLTETGTTTANGVPTALDHIKDLGVTHVHLLPVYDYGSVDETKLDTPQFNWGYDPVNYNVPEGSYSTDPYNGAVRVKEMKEMVMTLHENNINVIMDVVYNHVYDAESFSFNQIVPKYFSRTYADGSYSSGSGCGNDTASERAMVQKYIIESVLYWAEEYHIDGFRFDLVGLIDTETMNGVIEAVHAKYPDIIFYGEGWTMATETSKDVSMSTQTNAYLTPELAYFSDTIRNLLAGDNSATNPGFVSGLKGQESSLASCVTATTSWCPSPSQTVNYASCHDNYTLKDKLNLTRADASEADRIKMNNLAASVYMMSQGIPFIHAGEEFLRTKVHEDGTVEHNSYNSPDFVNALRWNNIEDETYADVVEYYKGLIEFRKNHESLRLTTKAEVAANMEYHWVTNEVVLFELKGKDSVEGEVSDGIVVIFNATNQDKEISLYNYGIAEGDWQVCINGEDAGIEVLETITNGKVTADAISATVLVLGETEDDASVYIDNYREPVEDDDTDKPSKPGSSSGSSSSATENETSTDATTDTTTQESTGTVGSEIKLPTKEELEEQKETIEIVVSDDATIEEKTEVIIDAIEEVKEGHKVVVKVEEANEGSAEVSIEVFRSMEENSTKKADLVIELANGFTWTISTDSIDSTQWEEDMSGIDFWVEMVEDVVPDDLIETVKEDKHDAIEISLKHNGEFGMKAALNVPLGIEYAGKEATLYYFNEAANAMEKQAVEKVDENGNVQYIFTHASDYVIMVEEAEEIDLDLSVDSTEEDTSTEVIDTENEPEGGNGILPILLIVCILAAITVVVVLKKKRQ